MKPRGEALEYQRLRAPQADGESLIEPPAASVGELLAHNRALASAYDRDLHGRSVSKLRKLATSELIKGAWRYTEQYRDLTDPVWLNLASKDAPPVFLAGHQPQLFHPGVWFKNFVLSRLAAEHGGVAVNLVIDSDTIKSAALRVPGGTVDAPLIESVPLDDPTPEIPYEERAIVNPACLAEFGTRATEVIRSLVPDPLVRDFWPLVVARARECRNLGECISQARHQQEAAWHGNSLELPQSRIGDFESFHWFAAHLLARAGDLREIYNGAVAEYRRVNHVRSTAHPVPDLAVDGDWSEAPFWIWTASDPRRRRVFVRQRAGETVVTDREGLEVPLSLAQAGDAGWAVQQLAALKARGIKLRTRALVTTMFARLVLGDVFLHGIGGAKYDQVTDLIIRRFFGVEPPGYMTVTATLRLPIAYQTTTPDDARRIDRELRELTYHPERWLDGAAQDPAVRDLVHTKRQWIKTEQTRENARTRCRAIRAANESLQPWIAPRREQLQARREGAYAALPGEAILRSREYAFCLYPESALKNLMGL